MAEEKTITLKKSDIWKYSTFVLIAILIVAGFLLFGGNRTGTTNTGTNNPKPINAEALIEANDPVLGNADAKISIIEFSDFQCIFCAKAYNEALAEFKNSSYFKNGEINLIYKQLPLDTACNTGLSNQLHPNACESAEASLCADEQGKFWEYHNMLFENQQALATENLKSYASTLGLDTGKFNTCLDSGKYASEVKKEISQGTSAGGTGTPFFIIVNFETKKTTTLSGAYPWSQFESAIGLVK